MKRVLLFFFVFVLLGQVYAAERPTVAILPFGVAKDRSSLRWMGLATASTLAEKLRRVPEVRVLPMATVMHELQSAGVDPSQASWTPAVATGPLGQWLNADVVMIGAVGKTRDRKIADVVLQAPDQSVAMKGAQLWLAARLVDIHTGETLSRAYLEGREDDLFGLQQELLVRLGAGMGLVEQLVQPAVMQSPTMDFRAYEVASEAEGLILDLYQTEDAKKREKDIKRALKLVEKALKYDAHYAGARTWEGTLFALQKRPKLAMKSFDAAAALDPAFAAPRYGLVDLAFQQEDLSQALMALDQVLAAVPWDDEAHYLKGTVLRLLHRNDEALVSFETAIDLYSRRGEVFYAAGQLYVTQRHLSSAIQAFQHAVDLVPGDMAYQIALANALLGNGQKEQARQILDHVASLAADNPEYQLVRGKLALSNGHLDEAIRQLMQVRQAQPDRLDVLVTLGKIYVQQTRYADAIEVFVAAQSGGLGVSEFAGPYGEALEALGQKKEAADVYRQALEQTEDVVLRLRLVTLLLARRASDEAMAVLRTGVQLHPDRGDMHVLLGDLYVSKSMGMEAIRHYERAVALGMKTPEVMVVLGDLYGAQAQWGQARSWYQRALDAGAMGADVYVKVGKVEELREDLRAALVAYRAALKVQPHHVEAMESVARLTQLLRPKPQPMGASDYASRATRLYESGDLVGARVALEKAVGLAPKNARFWNDLGALYAKLGDLTQAEKAFEKANRFAPNAPGNLYNLARLYTDTGRLDHAEGACREALAQDSGYLPARRQLAAIYMMRGEKARAQATYQEALKQLPDDGDLNLGLGNALLSQGDLAGAEQAYVMAQKGMPLASAPEIGLGNVRLAQRDTTQALVHYRVAAERNDPTAFVNLGAIQTARNKTEQAVKTYQKALTLAPNDRDVLMNLVVLYFKAKQYSDALGYCRTLQERFVGDFEVQRLTGMVAYAGGEYELALIAYQEAADRNPGDPQTQRGLATTFEALNQMGEAKGHWERWLMLVGDDPARQSEVLWVTEHIKKLPAL